MAVTSTGHDKTVAKEVPTTEELLAEILLQLKINNAQLALITGEEVSDGPSD